MLRTTAERVDGGWSISGRKWFITGAEGAAFTICMALAEGSATMFLVDAENPGYRVERTIEATDRAFPGGHGEVVFEDCRVGDEAVLGAVGEGFAYAQVRLAPARLTHCMRWLGSGAAGARHRPRLRQRARGLRLQARRAGDGPALRSPNR